MARKKKDKTTENQKVSDKIKLLRSEGTPEKQAIAESLSMERSGRLGEHGTYYRTPRRRTRRTQ